MSLYSMNRRLEKVALCLAPVARESRLPYVVVNHQGADLPGYALHNREHEALARRLGVLAKVYHDVPGDDGSEP